MVVLYIVLGVIFWLAIGYLTAYLDHTYNLTGGGEYVNGSLGAMLLGGLITFVIFVVTTIWEQSRKVLKLNKVVDKLKFKDNNYD